MSAKVRSGRMAAALVGMAVGWLAFGTGSAGAVVATWNFSGTLDADLAVGGAAPTMSYYDAATQGVTTFGTTNGGSALELAVPDLPDGPAGFLHHPALPNDGAGGYLLDFAAGTFQANGGGAYVNSYTVMVDQFVAVLDWTAIFQTAEAHVNDADWYVDPAGAVGIGELGYSAAGVVTAGAWHRLAFVRDTDAGIVKYFVDGAEVFSGAPGGVDGRFSLYTGDNPGPDLVFRGEGEGSGNYTNEAWISSLLIADYALSDAAVAALGGPSAAGIVIPEPSSSLMLALSALGGVVFFSRRRTGS